MSRANCLVAVHPSEAAGGTAEVDPVSIGGRRWIAFLQRRGFVTKDAENTLSTLQERLAEIEDRLLDP
ncbi:hypothetical protein [Allorhodopirellula heiligendammensis]|uniref:hypothetical protein n=1 Tax=Allorhodopirellula heiligendammensis TaxID=2714739 RepID=UPI0011B3C76B|nr:hypothetical protein [Allorhodopirellula heiligendammensis]